jgi:hypothetical protein
MKIIFVMLILIIGTVCLQAGDASATIISVGDPFNSGSWSATFRQSDIGYFDRIEALVLTGNKFKTGLENLSRGDWNVSLVSSSYAYVSGHHDDGLEFDMHFDGVHSDNTGVVNTSPVDLRILTSCDNIIKEDIFASWDGRNWRFEDFEGHTCGNPVAPVPEPSTMVLLGAGFAALGIMAKRRKHQL